MNQKGSPALGRKKQWFFIVIFLDKNKYFLPKILHILFLCAMCIQYYIIYKLNIRLLIKCVIFSSPKKEQLLKNNRNYNEFLFFQDSLRNLKLGPLFKDEKKKSSVDIGQLASLAGQTLYVQTFSGNIQDIDQFYYSDDFAESLNPIFKFPKLKFFQIVYLFQQKNLTLRRICSLFFFRQTFLLHPKSK